MEQYIHIDWGMRFNSKKCYIFSVKNKSQHYYSLGGSILQRVQNNPYLGIEFSEDLKFTHLKNYQKSKLRHWLPPSEPVTLPNSMSTECLSLLGTISY